MDLFSQRPADPPERVLSVAQLTRRLRDTIESGFRNLWVKGEISNFRRQSSGHCYFTLKDASAQLACVLFKNTAQQVLVPMHDGLALQLQGDLSVYEARGQYQLVVRRVLAAGAGSLQLQFEALKQKLAAEGLFAQELKQPIPSMPATVAVITSPTGAALKDMLNVLSRRAPWLRILVVPVRVQGLGAANEIAAALAMVNAESGRSRPRIDTVVITRGGGSIEDLWAFNEEIVARALHASSLPVISAVGHEIDFTIADFVADLRAPTPSAAAELLTPDRADLLASLTSTSQRLQRRVLAILANARRIIDLTARGPLQRDPDRILLPWRQSLDATEAALADATTHALTSRLSTLRDLAQRLAARRPNRVLAERTAALAMAAERLHARAASLLDQRRAALQQRAALLRTLGPDSVLSRGFTCTLDAAGRVVREPSALQPGDSFQTRFRRGRITGTVVSVDPDAPQAKS